MAEAVEGGVGAAVPPAAGLRTSCGFQSPSWLVKDQNSRRRHRPGLLGATRVKALVSIGN